MTGITLNPDMGLKLDKSYAKGKYALWLQDALTPVRGALSQTFAAATIVGGFINIPQATTETLILSTIDSANVSLRDDSFLVALRYKQPTGATTFSAVFSNSAGTQGAKIALTPTADLNANTSGVFDTAATNAAPGTLALPAASADEKTVILAWDAVAKKAYAWSNGVAAAAPNATTLLSAIIALSKVTLTSFATAAFQFRDLQVIHYFQGGLPGNIDELVRKYQAVVFSDLSNKW